MGVVAKGNWSPLLSGPKAGAWRAWAAGCALGWALCATAVQASPIPFGERQVDMTVREQPIAAFLQDFFGTMDVPVSVSSGVKGAVNGVFRGTAEKVFSSIQRSFGLMAYYDGAVVHVKPKAFQLLAFLIANAGRVYSREQLLDAAWRRSRPGVIA